jgi:serine/threonine protein kinase/tetratricopeptide (TPR) repeat protein
MEKTIENPPTVIGPYGIIQSLGKGGMGEVFLAKDPMCGRRVALKRIRPELRLNKTIQNRFLREAEVASALSHPSIVPILSIQTLPPDVYYTMPFVEGSTLRQLLKSNSEQGIVKSIPSLARIFLQICEAVAYTHSKGILHRDLKPENIIVGKYGEVMILDWGIADFIDQIGEDEVLPASKKSPEEDLTRPGKITGTLAYMAPERLLGKASSVQTDLYALGVILYQMLTLQLPFQRKSIAAFRKQVHNESFIDPVEMAPYRDIPHQLSEVCHRCLARSEQDRYQNVEDLIAEIKSYIEGRPQWILATELKTERKEDWQFQENILLAKNIAITRSLDVTEWAELMISRATFTNNMRLTAEVRLSEKGHGLGFLLSVPKERHSLEEGYCLWIGHNACKLFRNNVQLHETKILQPKTWYQITIEKIDDHLKFFVDGKLKLNFASHLPLAGNHIGLLHKDGEFEIKNLKIYDASHNAMVGCLAVPNAFLSHKLYDTALQEYRRIGQSFPGRIEGREALFRAGLTLIEKARAEEDDQMYHLALKEFEKLYKTPGAPLEYLGKSLVYKAIGDTEEEAKCLELSLRKFPHHPLLPMLKEHIIYRMHESSLNNRESAYRIILLAIRHIPDLLENSDTRHLIESLEKNLEPLPFIEKCSDRLNSIAILLAFWLAKVPILVEIAQSVREQETLFNNALVCLQELEAVDALEKFLPQKPRKKKTLVVWNSLLNHKLKEAKEIFDQFPEAIHQESSPLYFPYGTYLYLTKGRDAAFRHFASALETTYPPTTALPSLFLTNRLQGWIDRAFWWEKKELHRQIDLFYRCVGKK